MIIIIIIIIITINTINNFLYYVLLLVGFLKSIVRVRCVTVYKTGVKNCFFNKFI